MVSAAYNARKRASRKAARESGGASRKAARESGGASRKAGLPSRTGARKDDPATRRRRELEEAYVDTFMSNPMPAHAAGNPSFRQFVRDHARAMSDEALAAYVNLSSGADDDDAEAMSRDMNRAMGDVHRAAASMGKNFR